MSIVDPRTQALILDAEQHIDWLEVELVKARAHLAELRRPRHQHGTVQRLWVHRKEGTPPCAPCLRAGAAYEAMRTRARRQRAA